MPESIFPKMSQSVKAQKNRLLLLSILARETELCQEEWLLPTKKNCWQIPDLSPIKYCWNF